MTSSLRIRTAGFRPLAPPELTDPIERDLEDLYETEVEADYWPTEPPAAGFSEIAFTVILTGMVALIVDFFKPLVTAGGEALRDDFLSLLAEARRNKEGTRGYVPLCIKFGVNERTPVRYYFHGNLDDEELLKRLRAANDHIRTIPPERFDVMAGPSEYGFFWDDERQAWRGAIYGYPDGAFGEYWMPSGILRADDV